jgi:hypothetical protein
MLAWLTESVLHCHECIARKLIKLLSSRLIVHIVNLRIEDMCTLHKEKFKRLPLNLKIVDSFHKVLSFVSTNKMKAVMQVSFSIVCIQIFIYENSFGIASSAVRSTAFPTLGYRIMI